MDLIYIVPYGNLGSVLSSQGRVEEAEWAFRRALHFRPNMADVHYNLPLEPQPKVEGCCNQNVCYLVRRGGLTYYVTMIKLRDGIRMNKLIYFDGVTTKGKLSLFCTTYYKSKKDRQMKSMIGVEYTGN
ncbi:hypothetical protein NQ317_010392 [Molorchus minor]|uniref:Tetratricopeptide repeat protein n=1 Tax=Molorchus minor TaxID=1323400 RepID=A0ABQ9J9H1_9CUCU|nr:hypothetical protein NQ317_010392 [Molorchus minor]